MEFQPWPKIPRYNRGILITEKIDGTNAQLRFTPVDGDPQAPENQKILEGSATNLIVPGLDRRIAVHVGSRKRWLQPGKHTDNFGFAGWAVERAQELYGALGMGGHYGEWYGVGIQRGYGLVERRLALFNTDKAPAIEHLDNVEVVPELYRGPMGKDPNDLVNYLNASGSLAVPGWMKPEGVVIYHLAARTSFKVLCENDDVPKGNTDDS